MAVYTDVSFDTAAELIARLSIGTLTSLQPCAGGIENTNYFADTTRGRYVLTLFERLTHAQLPFYLQLMKHLAERGIPVPGPHADASGSILHTVHGKPAAVVDRLPGRHHLAPDAAHCAMVGAMLARMHRAAADFPLQQPNLRGLAWWAETVPVIVPFVTPAQRALLETELAFQQQFAASAAGAALPRGAIHADLFRDNVLWDTDADGSVRIGGVIDFYFAGFDALLFDVAVTVNDWCSLPGGGLDEARVAALLAAYHAERAFTATERAAWPAMLRAAALRFWLSRAADFHLPRAGEMVMVKDPDEYRDILRLHSAGVQPLPH